MTTGQQLGVDMANTFMLTLLFNLIADMSENPDGVSNRHKNSTVRIGGRLQIAGRRAGDGAGSPRRGKAGHRGCSSKLETV